MQSKLLEKIATNRSKEINSMNTKYYCMKIMFNDFFFLPNKISMPLGLESV